jgi:ribosomal protein S18 acetylase RimI-like enzyme
VNRVVMHRATRADVPTLVVLLADDVLGREREVPVAIDRYLAAFDAIERDANQALMVATIDDRTVGMLQLTFTPLLSHGGSWRATVESVRVTAADRSAGVGRQMLEWAIACAAHRGCRLVQLTTDKSRTAAIRFYQRLGFRPTHEGMKLALASSPNPGSSVHGPLGSSS